MRAPFIQSAATVIALTVVALTVSASRVAAQSPSFACTGPVNSAEYKICTTPALAAADQRMADVYESVKRHIRPRSDVPFFVGDQKRWLAQRDACGSKRCIGRAYAQRIETLESYAVIRDD